MVSKRARRLARKEIQNLIKLIGREDIPIEYRLKYIELIRKLSMKFRVKPPRFYRLFICRKCKSPLYPGYNVVYRVRSRPKKAIVVKCLKCGHVYRYVYKS